MVLLPVAVGDGLAAPRIDLPQGAYAGQRVQGVAVFKGIPYAAPPFGRQRFLPPQPVAAHAGVAQATEFAPPSAQVPRLWAGNTDIVGGDNCLCLNVWSGAAPGERRPVLVWIPGGGFMRGDAGDPLYDGMAFAQQGVVVVTFNYRVGVDGFMHLPGAPDNRGLLDQLAALRWVQNNIEAFGGDPAAVTVGGSSAGAGSLACLLSMPASHGLVRRAILQSPSVACQSPEEAAVAAQAIATLLGVMPSQQAMGEVPLHAVVRAVARLAADHGLRQQLGLGARHQFPLRPVIDGVTVRASPLAALASAWRDQDRPALDILVGANTEEMRFYLVPEGDIQRIGMDRVHGFAQACGAGAELVNTYRQAQPDATPGELLSAMQSDYYYVEPARRLAALACAAGHPTRHYQFAWPSPAHGGQLRAAHAVELPFVFNTPGSPQGLALTGGAAPAGLATRMNTGWAEFVRNGQVSGWPVVQGHKPVSMRFDTTSQLTPMPLPGAAAGWSEPVS